MFRNLKAEMIKQNVSLDSIAQALDLKPETARRKINGSIALSLNESFKISKLFSTNNSIEYLFAKDIRSPL